jgi:hypothetical protein
MHMNPSNPQPPDNEWPIISSYTDTEAVEDGELIDIGPLNVSVSPREDRGELIPRRPLNRMTRGLWHDLWPLMTGRDGRAHMHIFARWLNAKVEAAVYHRDIWQVAATEVVPTLWFLPNEVGGWTVMRPEDY